MGCGILSGGDGTGHVQHKVVEPHYAPIPAPLNPKLPGKDLAAGSTSSDGHHAKATAAGTARSKSNEGSKSSSGLQLFDPPSGLCIKDKNGERTGCRVTCQCAVLERCYPKFRTASAKHIDIGVCNPAVAVLVFCSIFIIGNSVACVVVLRVFFQWRERIRTMMESGYSPEEAAADPRMLPTKTFLIARSQNAPAS